MIDPSHLNDLSEMTVGEAARAAFLHASGMPAEAWSSLRLDLYALLVMTKGQDCGEEDVSAACWIAAERDDPRDRITWGDEDDVGEGQPGPPLAIEEFVREAAAALDALSKFEPGERVLIGKSLNAGRSAVIVANAGDDLAWYVADKPGAEPWLEWAGRIYRAPLAQPLPFPAPRDPEQPGGAA